MLSDMKIYRGNSVSQFSSFVQSPHPEMKAEEYIKLKGFSKYISFKIEQI